MPPRPLLAAALLLALVPALPAAAAPAVVTDIPPVHSIVARVMAGVGTPELLLAPGASPHDYALRPSDARAIADADLLVWVGPSLSPWLDAAADGLAGDGASLVLTDLPGIAVLPFRKGTGEEAHAPVDAEGHGDEHHADAHEDAHEDGHGDHGHVHTGVDPHLWLDPRNAAVIATAAAAALSAADPANAAVYGQNARAFVAEAAALEAEINRDLERSRGRGYVVFHDAYQYFETRFALPASGWILLADGAPPSAARVAAIRDDLRHDDIVCVFAEPEFAPDLAETLVAGTGARAGRLDGLGIGLAPGPDLYPALMRGIAKSFADCLAPGA